MTSPGVGLAPGSSSERLRSLLARPFAPAPHHRLVRWWILRLLAVVYLAAFASLGGQMGGLVGDGGILPASRLLVAAAAELGPDVARSRLPTLSWWLGADDTGLELLVGIGLALALLALAGVAQRIAFAGLWACYLSLLVVGQLFLSFQWDALLLEAGFLAILWAPSQLRPRLPYAESPPLRLVTWLVRWLTFRLMVTSGLVKLLSGDPTWRDLSALTFHYATQPLPNPLSWLAHQLPLVVHQLATVGMFAIELAVPLLLFSPRRLRVWAVPPLLAFQVLIAATGNYGFFNLLTAVLCLSYLDDRQLARWLGARIRRWLRLESGLACPGLVRRWRWLSVPPALMVLALSIVPTASLTGGYLPVPAAISRLYRATAGYHLVNRYGLFAVMTTHRPEILIEGSDDGVGWKTYELPWKASSLDRRPGQAAPHMPRLDWQLWFAALAGDYRRAPWTVNLAERLLAGAPQVLGLFEHNPFPDAPPRYLRMQLAEYRFTTPHERRASGHYWARGDSRPFLPVVTAASFTKR